MKAEIIKFYEDKHLAVPNIINRYSHEHLPEQFEEAAEDVYNEIQAGLVIKDIAIVDRVRAKARVCSGKKYAQENERYEQHKEIVTALEKSKGLWQDTANLLKAEYEALEEKYDRLQLWVACSTAGVAWLYVAYKVFL